MSNRKHHVIGHDGDPCPRCGIPTEIREHVEIGVKQLLRQPFYYSRWFCCRNPECQTTLIMPKQFIVWNEPPDDRPTLDQRRLDAIKQQLRPRE